VKSADSTIMTAAEKKIFSQTVILESQGANNFWGGGSCHSPKLFCPPAFLITLRCFWDEKHYKFIVKTIGINNFS